MAEDYCIVYIVTPSKGLKRLILPDCSVSEKLNVTVFLSFALKSPIRTKMRLKFIMWQYVENFTGSPNYDSCCRGLAF